MFYIVCLKLRIYHYSVLKLEKIIIIVFFFRKNLLRLIYFTYHVCYYCHHHVKDYSHGMEGDLTCGFQVTANSDDVVGCDVGQPSSYHVDVYFLDVAECVNHLLQAVY